MSNSVIRVNNLSKRYRIGIAESNKTFREAIVDSFKSPIRNFNRLHNLTKFKSSSEADAIWALKNVTFEVNEGDVLGIIGRNGAGKTTLLKVLSRITEPTDGFAEIYGRVSSLLEIGIGFHPELTGRENILLNGAIMGMRKREVEGNLSDIIAFAGIEKFLDTPIKRYSSGMYVRLAFSVAAHLKSDILLVDEVLAVGDLAFQKKCLGKMGEMAKSGRTVLFISHNMGAILNLCQRAIWLDNGCLIENGDSNKVVRDYEENQLKLFDESSSIAERHSDEIKGRKFYISRVEILNNKGEHSNVFRYNENLILVVSYEGYLNGEHFSPEFRIYNELGQLVCTGASKPYHDKWFSSDDEKVKIEIGSLILTSGKYRISLSVMTESYRADTWDDAVAFTIIECQPFVQNWDIPTFREGACVINHSFSKVNEK